MLFFFIVLSSSTAVFWQPYRVYQNIVPCAKKMVRDSVPRYLFLYHKKTMETSSFAQGMKLFSTVLYSLFDYFRPFVPIWSVDFVAWGCPRENSPLTPSPSTISGLGVNDLAEVWLEGCAADETTVDVRL